MRTSSRGLRPVTVHEELEPCIHAAEPDAEQARPGEGDFAHPFAIASFWDRIEILIWKNSFECA